MKKYIFLFSIMFFLLSPTLVHAEGCECVFTVVVNPNEPCGGGTISYILPYETPFILGNILQTISPGDDEACTIAEINRLSEEVGNWTGTPKKSLEGEENCGMDVTFNEIDEKVNMVCSHAEGDTNYSISGNNVSNSTGALSQPKEREYVEIPNPLKGNYTLQQLMGLIVNRFMGVLGSITLVVFVYGGFMFLTAAGNDEKVKKGTNAMLYAAIGLFIIFGAYVILNMVLGQILGV